MSVLFRVADGFAPRSTAPLRLLALVAPGDLMVNTPLDFITAHLDVRLDLLFVVPGQALPARVPDHDLAFFAVSESDPATLRAAEATLRRAGRVRRSMIPKRSARLSREALARLLAGLPGVCSPRARRLSRAPAAKRRNIRR